jgi:hypothetical protein
MAKQPRQNTGNHPTEPQAENPRAVAGGNNPPSQIELMTEKHKPLLDRLDKLAARATDLPTVIKNEEHLTAVTAVVLEVRTLSGDERKAFKAEKEPWLTGSREVDTFFNTTFRDRIERMAEKLQRRCDDYAREQAAAQRAALAEQERKAKAEADRQAALAEKHAGTGRAAQHETRAEVAESHAQAAGEAANAPVADLTRVRTGGATVSGKETWVGKIEDFGKLQASLGPLGSYFKPDEIEGAVARMAKATQDRIALPGVKFETAISANIRKR